MAKTKADLRAAFLKSFDKNYESEAEKARSSNQNAAMALDPTVAKASFAGLDTLDDTFCDLYEKVDKFLDRVLGPAEWIFPKQVAIVKGFIKAFEETFLPIICGDDTDEDTGTADTRAGDHNYNKPKK